MQGEARRYEITHLPDHKPIKSWTIGVPVEAAAWDQLKNVARMPFIYRHVAAMPDVHWGMGATVGSVIPTKGAVIPAAVGVDLGCGVAAVRLDGARAEHLPESLGQIRSEIEHTVPVGFGQHANWNTQLDRAAGRTKSFLTWLEREHPRVGVRRKHSLGDIVYRQFGTLGGGNHFIELCISDSDDLWLMLHSGSRGIGNAIGQYFIEIAKKDMRRHFINLPDENLAYLPEGTDHYADYMRAVEWAQTYAAANRAEMLRRVLIVLHRHLPPFRDRTEVVNCHHNYVTLESHFGQNVLVTRKGAVRARKGDLGIIPGSMGARSYIVRGKGNAESFHSCSHGAGRAMSRKKARSTFTVLDHEAATLGIECRKDEGVLDETPGAYKDIDKVMEAQRDLVEIVHTLSQVICVKG